MVWWRADVGVPHGHSRLLLRTVLGLWSRLVPSTSLLEGQEGVPQERQAHAKGEGQEAREVKEEIG